MCLETRPTQSTLDQAVSGFVEVRPRLFGIAYRVLGSAVEAEDVVQEVWLRWQKTDRSAVVSPVAYLSSTTTRLAINVAQSARVRRETYIGPWLPEPIDTSTDPEVGAQRGEALELALLLVLEKLNPNERAAYVLREAFDYDYAEIAEILHLSPVNVRKIVSRARKHLSAEQRETVDTAEHRRLLEAFVLAARTGNVASLEALLTPDAVSLSDGNGIRGTARIPVLGRARVAKLATYARLWSEVDVQGIQANGRSAVMIHRDGRPTTFMTIAASQEGIYQLMWVFNPSKITTYLDSRSRSMSALGAPEAQCGTRLHAHQASAADTLGSHLKTGIRRSAAQARPGRGLVNAPAGRGSQDL
ncbi:RNA polymerase sigma-70 factor [Streptomyces dengpaensis]|uniref:RNA polymerase sigma-70 factor n=1 Tax=Streptomyces dengpaensis TaxID=2049881 RepID=A0ABN5IEM6_9ACTN|nr:RNA polymerase sigma-70 factor [Streptomyces dengpaensis]